MHQVHIRREVLAERNGIFTPARLYTGVRWQGRSRRCSSRRSTGLARADGLHARDGAGGDHRGRAIPTPAVSPGPAVLELGVGDSVPLGWSCTRYLQDLVELELSERKGWRLERLRKLSGL